MECLTLKKSNCKNCYKCIRNCPVKSIRFSGNQAYIIDNECILCGQCFVMCPQNAKQIVDETEKVKVLLQSGDPVIVSLAPSFVANYEGAGIGAMRKALVELGFFDVEETAIGAEIITHEYEKLLNDSSRNIIITSCCHSINLLIQKHFPAELPFLADIMSPMQAHCMEIKKRMPNAKTVFIGPCVAKKDEAQHYEGIVDAVLTFDELTSLLKEKNITIEAETDEESKKLTRFYPTTGGIIKSLVEKNPNYSYLAIDGATNCIEALKDIENGNIKNCFIEMSACVGSCVGGPVMEKFHRSPVKDYIAISNFAGEAHYDIEFPDSSTLHKHFDIIKKKLPTPSEEEITATLHKIGKLKPSDELNCGSCGYNTCREKAIAIIQGKAEVSMCLPFLKDKAENFSDTVARNTPNALIVLNEKLEVQQINKAALRILNLQKASDILGDPVVRVLNTDDIVKVLENEKDIHDKRIFLAEYDKYIEETIVYDKEYHLLLCILRDVTGEEKQRQKRENISRQTIETADKVVNKQMRIVQEIASLLGETTAETKIALSNLKETINNE